MQNSSANEFSNDVLDSGAIFDSRRKYRYLLWRKWNQELPGLCFVMLNPSTADESKNDPTISRCVGFAQRWGFGSVDVVNAFAYRATDSAALRTVRDPVGRLADQYIKDAIERNATLVVAWGNWGSLRERHRQLAELIGDREAFGFGLTKQMQPKHPLYIRNDAPLLRLELSD